MMNLFSCSPKSEFIIKGTGEKILFIGNSFTFIHGGVEKYVKKLAASAVPSKHIEVESKSIAGATLAIHYNLPETHDVIRDGSYDVVILQGDIPELTEKNIDPFLKYSRLFDQEIKATGAKTMFFMTWPYERLNWITLDEIVTAHKDISAELNSLVAPVGIAFQQASEEQPELAVLIDDKEHESIYGIYLAACVIYSTLFGESSEGLTFVPPEISAEESMILQKIAWETIQKWSKEQKY